MAEPTTGNPESRRAAPPTKQVTKPAQALGEILVERKLVTKGQLAQAMDRQKRTRRRLGRVLVEMGFATPETILEALSGQLGCRRRG